MQPECECGYALTYKNVVKGHPPFAVHDKINLQICPGCKKKLEATVTVFKPGVTEEHKSCSETTYRQLHG